MTDDEFFQKLRDGWEIVSTRVDTDLDTNSLRLDILLMSPPEYVFTFTVDPSK